MHARDRHFLNNGSELDAPVYIYFDMLSFMREFSIKKEIVDRDSYTINISEIIPDTLEYIDEENQLIDVTKIFLSHIKKYPILYESNAEFRKFRGKNEWKTISDSLYSRFTIGKLRNYWIVLMKKFKLYEENRHQLHGSLKNEYIFHQMSFVRKGINVKKEFVETHEEYVLEDQYDLDDRRFINQVSKESYLDNFIDENINSSEECNEIEDTIEETEVIIEQDEYDNDDELYEPTMRKRFKTDETIDIDNKVCNLQTESSQSPIVQKCIKSEELDEYDYFGKKVALQLRHLARKNRNISRKAEIQVLQLLMEMEESLEKI